jgi:replicative DNA helicase
MQLTLGRLRVKDFRGHILGIIWEVASEYYAASRQLPPRETLLMESSARVETGRIPCGNVIGGTAAEAIAEAFSIPLDENYGRQLLSQFILEAQAGAAIREMANSSVVTPESIEELHQALRNANISGSSAVDLARHSAAVLLNNPDTFRPVRFVTSGYEKLDTALGGGLAEGEATSLSAPAGVAKTTLAVNMALRIAATRMPVGIVSLEMPAADIARLMVAIDGNIRRRAVRESTLTVEETARFTASITRLSSLPIYIVDRRDFAVDPEHPEAPAMQAVGDLIRDGVERHGWRLVIIDYLAKIGPFDVEDLVRYPRLTNWAFDTARRTGVHVLALMQANKAAYSRRDARTKKPTAALEDTKGTIEVVADFDNAAALTRADWNSEQQTDPSDLKAIALKVRQGPGGTVPFVFHKSTGRIVEPPPPAPPRYYGGADAPASPAPTAPSPAAQPVRPESPPVASQVRPAFLRA